MNNIVEKVRKASEKFLNEVMHIEDIELSDDERNEVCRQIDEVIVHGEIAKEVINS
jgi:hypothetical protein